MINALYESLPDNYEGYRIDTSYQTSIQVQDILNDEKLSVYEAVELAVSFLFGKDVLPNDIWVDALEWWLNGWSHDNVIVENNEKIMDFYQDQWRIISAFKNQYDIDLTDSETDMHWWKFMGLLSTLNECAFTHACDIRGQTIDNDMTPKEKSRIRKLKQIYVIQNDEQKAEIKDEKARIIKMLDGG